MGFNSGFKGLTKNIMFVNFVTFLLNLLISLLLLMGQFSDLITAAFRLSLSCSSSLQSNNMWTTVCSSLLQEHTGLSRILFLCRYDLILPRPITIVVKFGITLRFSFNLSSILGRNNFVIATTCFGHNWCC